MEVGDRFIYDCKTPFKVENKFGTRVTKRKIEPKCIYELTKKYKFFETDYIYFRKVKNGGKYGSKVQGNYDFFLPEKILGTHTKLKRHFRLLSEYRETRLNKILTNN
ncbi:MAG: hypothetical protein SLAVMIC_00169 [uncultured marine phage]|uniref:Uncharacterized protein n=1 Tax=uncultured marine phage TaxID=707152 RepID=A0A8D9C9J1_9VIRU|nr:MAG: hypothetical protein SLAVMIC_00169 [uncultured marine phage]